MLPAVCEQPACFCSGDLRLAPFFFFPISIRSVRDVSDISQIFCPGRPVRLAPGVPLWAAGRRRRRPGVATGAAEGRGGSAAGPGDEGRGGGAGGAADGCHGWLPGENPEIWMGKSMENYMSYPLVMTNIAENL